jgi:hypothetical protein
LTLAQVVKYTQHHFSLDRFVLRGSCTMLVRLRNATQGSGTINTAFIERLNGTFRTYLAPLVRRTHHLARSQPMMTDAVFLFGCVYNFCRPHSAFKRATPAMIAGLTDHIWSIADLLWVRSKPPSPSSTAY